MSMLKIIITSQVLVTNEVLTANKIGGIKVIDKSIEKSERLSKTKISFKSGNSKDEKLFKSQKSAKSRKKLLKNRNSSNFNAKKNGLSFLIPKTRVAFNRLLLDFTKVSIL